MRMFHIISAKKLGWDQVYDYIPFPADQYTKEEAMAQFRRVQKETLKDNNHWYSYTAYEYDDQLYHSIIYSGLASEDEYLSHR